MFTFTEADLHSFYSQVIQITAAKLGIANSEFKTSFELLEEIKASNARSHQALNDFIDAYENWYKGVVKENVTGQQAIIELIRKRDAARQELLKSLA